MDRVVTTVLTSIFVLADVIRAEATVSFAYIRPTTCRYLLCPCSSPPASLLATHLFLKPWNVSG